MADINDDTIPVAAGVRAVKLGRGTPPAPSGTPQPPAHKYRWQADRLFHRAHAATIEGSYINQAGDKVVIASHAAMSFDGRPSSHLYQACGSTDVLVCRSSGWIWQNPGADWEDSALQAQGASAWASSRTIAQGETNTYVDIDVTTLVNRCDSLATWYAFVLLVDSPNVGNVSMPGPLNAGATKATLTVTRGGQQTVCPLWYLASHATNAQSFNGHDDWITVTKSYKSVIEFLRSGDQAVPATSAVMRLPFSSVTFGSATIRVMRCNPRVPDMNAMVVGMAEDYPLDAGIIADSRVAAALRVTDSTVIDDVLETSRVWSKGKVSYPWLPGGPMMNFDAEPYYDPNLWGTPGVGHLAAVAPPTSEQLAQLYPHRVITANGTKITGKAYRGLTRGDGIRAVSSAELTSRGLPVLAPGMGALEVTVAKVDGIENGHGYSTSLTTGSAIERSTDIDAYLHFKKEHFGQVVDGYMRMYVMLGEGWEPKDADMRWTWATGNELAEGKFPEQMGLTQASVQWRPADWAGKFPGGIQNIVSGVIYAEQPTYNTQLVGGVPNTSKTIRTVVNGENVGYSKTSTTFAYQGRWQFVKGFYKEGHTTPCQFGALLGMEFIDWQTPLDIPSQAAFLPTWEGRWQSQPGQIGGMGFLYAKKWYCVEMRWKMNTVTVPYSYDDNIGADYRETGFVTPVDGWIEWWIDGVKTAQSPNFAHRASRSFMDWALQLAQGRPFGERPGGTGPVNMRPATNVPPEAYLGARHAVLQAFYGGQSQCPRDHKILLNGIVVSSGAYIGPMKGVTRANGGLGY